MNLGDFRFLHHCTWLAPVDPAAASGLAEACCLPAIDVAARAYWHALAIPLQQDASVSRLAVRSLAATCGAGAGVATAPLRVGVRSAGCSADNTSLMLEVAVFDQQEQRLAEARLAYGFLAAGTQVFGEVPVRLREASTAFEAGLPVTRLEVGTWQALAEPAAALRKQVFVHEQGFSEEDEWDEMDASSLHAVIVNPLEVAIATGRLLPARAGVAKIGRMCVAQPLRGADYGSQVLKALETAARDRADHTVMLHAQTQARNFYSRNGYEAIGEIFDECGAPHITMKKRL